jgi:hypothetical protein
MTHERGKSSGLDAANVEDFVISHILDFDSNGKEDHDRPKLGPVSLPHP